MVFKSNFLLFLTNLHTNLSIIKLPFKFMQNCTFYMNAGQMAQSTIVQVKVLTPQHGYNKRINLVTTQLISYLVPYNVYDPLHKVKIYLIRQMGGQSFCNINLL